MRATFDIRGLLFENGDQHRVSMQCEDFERENMGPSGVHGIVFSIWMEYGYTKNSAFDSCFACTSFDTVVICTSRGHSRQSEPRFTRRHCWIPTITSDGEF